MYRPPPHRFSRRIFVPLPNKVTREALMRRAVEVRGSWQEGCLERRDGVRVTRTPHGFRTSEAGFHHFLRA